jgi:hypothetical protein
MFKEDTGQFSVVSLDELELAVHPLCHAITLSLDHHAIRLRSNLTVNGAGLCLFDGSLV